MSRLKLILVKAVFEARILSIGEGDYPQTEKDAYSGME